MNKLEDYRVHKAYMKFLEETKIGKEDFEKKSEEEQVKQLDSWFKENKYRIRTKKERVEKLPVKKVGDTNLTEKILFNDNLSDNQKVELLKQAYSIEKLKSDIKNIEVEIEELNKKIQAKKDEYKKQYDELDNKLK